MSMDGKRLMDLCSGLQHIGIPAADVEETCRFYEGLGFAKVFWTVIRGGQDVAFLQSGNLVLEVYAAEYAGADAPETADTVDAAEAADVADAPEAVGFADAPEAVGFADASEAVDVADAPETVEPPDASERVGVADAIDHIAVDCLDVEAAFQLAVYNGYVIVSDGIEELPFWEKGVRFFMIEGPNGERIEFDERLR